MKHQNGISKFLKVEIFNSSSKSSNKKEVRHFTCEVIGVAQKDKNGYQLHSNYKNYKDIIEKLIKTGEFSPKSGSCLVRYAYQGDGHTEHLLLVGLGEDKKGINAIGSQERLRRLGAQVLNKLSAEKIRNIVIHIESFLVSGSGFESSLKKATYSFIEGMGLAAYQFNKYFSQKEEKEPFQVYLPCTTLKTRSELEKGIEKATAVLNGAIICRDLSNEPSNELFPEAYAKRAKQIGSDHGVKVKVLDEKDLKKENMRLLLGVGQGSVHPPRLIVLEYTPKVMKKTTKTIAFVGKGMTFDSGGISIKPSMRMEDMKYDMCGSAAVVGAVAACAQLKLNVRILGIVATADNMPDGNAIQPGNIIRSRSGKTVEINNTDAEGRLILADALDYTQDLKPDYIIDLATLTGAATITLGYAAAGLMANHKEIAQLVSAASTESGERVWELPLYSEYFDDLKSAFADMRNTGDNSAAGTARAAIFMEQFIRPETKWAHLDIASMAENIPHIPYCPRKASSGFGVRLLVELAKSLEK